jgi:serine protease AprX
MPNQFQYSTLTARAGTLFRFAGLVGTAAAVLLGATALMGSRPAAAATLLPAVFNPSLAKLSSELHPLTSATAAAPADVTWARSVNGRVLVKVLIVASSADASLASLRADVLYRGGSVYYNFLSTRAIAAMVPASALQALAMRSDVLRISPNRSAKRQASLLQLTSNVTTTTTTATLSGSTSGSTDGRGVAIAVLDSGIDFRHRHFRAADGTSRVRGVVDIVALGKTLFGDGWKAGFDYSPSSKVSLDGTRFRTGDLTIRPVAPVPDAHGHGTAVASVAAGAGAYQ